MSSNPHAASGLSLIFELARWLFLLHHYMYLIRQSRTQEKILSWRFARSLHMSAEDGNYGGFGLPFAVVIVAVWASINLALNFVRCPPTRSLPCAACL